MASYIRRRKFLAALSGGAVAWPLAARAQQREKMRRIGVLVNLPADDPESQARVGAFLQGLQEFGWAIGRNVRIEYRWATDVASISRYAAELVASRTSSWPTPIRASRRCNGRPAPCRSYSSRSPNRLAPAWSKAWRDRAATLPVLSRPSSA